MVNRRRFRRTVPLSDQIRVAKDLPRPQAKQRADVQTFTDRTRRVLATYPAMSDPPAVHQPAGDLGEKVQEIFWYHTIELPGVTTQGMFDHRPLLGRYGIPDDLHGKRVLDIGTWDGFWAFEFERRGANVTAIDVEGLHAVDLPEPYRKGLETSGLKQYYSHGFELAHSALGSRVDRRQCNVYDLNARDFGTFDVVHMGDLVLHLEYPTRALQNVRDVTEDMAIISAPFEPDLAPDQVRYFGGWWNVVWWIPSYDAAAQMIFDAGFSSVEVQVVYELRGTVDEEGHWRAVFVARP